MLNFWFAVALAWIACVVIAWALNHGAHKHDKEDDTNGD